MQFVIHGRALRDDHWRLVAADEAPAGAPDGLILPLARWLAAERATAARSAVWLDGHADPQALLAHLAELPLIAVRFPVFTDGRGYSLARLLRERHGYRGELRAIGDVLRDQIAYLARCGFDSFALRADQDPAGAIEALDEISAYRRRSP